MGSTSNKAEIGVLTPLELVICDGEPGVVFRTNQYEDGKLNAANSFMSRKDMIEATDKLHTDHLRHEHSDQNKATIKSAYLDLNENLRAGTPLRHIAQSDIDNVSQINSVMEPIVARHKEGLSATHHSVANKPAYKSGTLEYIGPVEQLPNDYNNGTSMGKPGEMGAVFKLTEERGKNGEEGTTSIFMSDRQMKKALAEAPDGSINSNELKTGLDGSAKANGLVVAMTADQISKVKNHSELNPETTAKPAQTSRLELNLSGI